MSFASLSSNSPIVSIAFWVYVLHKSWAISTPLPEITLSYIWKIIVSHDVFVLKYIVYYSILSIILIVKSNFNIPFLRLSCPRCYHSLWCIPWVLCLIVSEKELELPTSLTFVGPWVRKSFGCFLWTVPTLYRLVLPMLCLFLYPSAFYLSAVQIW